MHIFLTIDIGNWILLIIVFAGLIVGYTKLNVKTKLNSLDIKLIINMCERCKDVQKQHEKLLRSLFNDRFSKIENSIDDIKDDTRKIALLLAKLNGIIATWLDINRNK